MRSTDMMGRTGGTATLGRVGMGSERDRIISDLFDAHYPSLRAVAKAMLGDASAAEEVTSEVFVKAFTGWRRFRSVEHQPAYLRVMVVNECRSRMRRRRIEQRVNALKHHEEEQRSMGADLERALSDLDLVAAVRVLPERQRACVVLRYLEDMSEREIADTLGCSTGTVKSQLFKARQRLERGLSHPETGGTA